MGPLMESNEAVASPTAFADGRAARPGEMRLHRLARLQRCQMRRQTDPMLQLPIHATAATTGTRVLRPPAPLPRALASREDAEVPEAAARLRCNVASPRRRRTTRLQPATELT